jgi:predicted lipoprotein with Yx(FWY)xxD motif
MRSANRPQHAARRFACRAAAVALTVGAISLSTTIGNTAGAAARHKPNRIIATTQNAQFGTILVSGKTVYTLKASKTPCTSRCLKVWPEVLVAKGTIRAQAGSGVHASMLGTIKRSGGARQVTYGGKPLYWFSGDSGAGQVNGNVTDTWGTWSVVVTAMAAQSSPGATTAPTTTMPVSPTTSAGTSPGTGSSPTQNTSPAPTSGSTSSPAPVTAPTPEASPTPSPTSPPATSPPATSPPATSPPATSPPATMPPSTGGASF